MADLSNKKDPLHLREERPDYVEDRVGAGNEDGVDVSETTTGVVSSEDVNDPGNIASVQKPVVALDMEKVAQAEREGKGFAQSDV